MKYSKLLWNDCHLCPISGTLMEYNGINEKVLNYNFYNVRYNI